MGLFGYFLLFTTQIGIIKYEKFSILFISIFFLSYIGFFMGSFIARYSSNYKSRYFSVNKIVKLKRINNVMILLNIILILISWYLTINYWGSLSYIFKNGHMIRALSIGDDGIVIIPRFISYLTSTNYVIAGISSFLLFYDQEKRNYLRLYIICFQ